MYIKKILILILTIYSYNILQAACCDPECTCPYQFVYCKNFSGDGFLATDKSAAKMLCAPTCPLCSHPALFHVCDSTNRDLKIVDSPDVRPPTIIKCQDCPGKIQIKPAVIPTHFKGKMKK